MADSTITIDTVRPDTVGLPDLRSATPEQIREQLTRTPVRRTMAITREGMNVDPDSRTVRVAFASDAPVDHWMGPLILTTKPAAVRTARMDQGLALLSDHDRCEQIGIVENFSFDTDGIIRGDARFSRSEAGEEAFQDVRDGIKRFVSVGFMIYELHVDSQKDDVTTYRCDDWEPFEISLVSVPADISVGVGRSLDNATQFSDARHSAISNNTETKMENPIETTPGTPVVNTPAQRIAEVDAAQRGEGIVKFAEIFGKGDLARQMLAASPDVTLDDVRTAIRQTLTSSATAPAPIAPEQQATIENRGVVQLARSLPQHGTVRGFGGNAEKAYRFGQWIAAIAGREGTKESARRFCLDQGIVRSFAEGQNENGGYLVPEEFGTDLILLREKYGVFRQNAKIVTMSSSDRTDPRQTGGLTAYFANEAEAATESTSTWDQVSLSAKKLIVLARISSELNEDSAISVGDSVANDIAYSFAKKEDECGFNGDGSSTYGGIIGAREKLKGLSGTISYIAGLQVATGNAYSEIVLADFEGVVARLPEYADSDAAAWYVHRSFYWNVMVKAMLASGGVTAAEVGDARQQRFMG